MNSGYGYGGAGYYPANNIIGGGQVYQTTYQQMRTYFPEFDQNGDGRITETGNQIHVLC